MTEFTKEFIDEARKSITEPGIERYICIPVQLEMLDEIERLQDKIAELESELVTTKQKLTDCEARNAELEKSSDELAEELSDMESAKDDVFDEAWKLKAKVAELEKTIEQLIEAGRALTSVAEWRYAILPELLAWDTLVDNIYKEREK